MINSLLAEKPNLYDIEDDLNKLSKTVKQIGENLDKISLSLNLNSAINGRAVERELDKDLGLKSAYLNRIEGVLRASNGKIPEPDRLMIKTQGDRALKAIEEARYAIGDSLKLLG